MSTNTLDPRSERYLPALDMIAAGMGAKRAIDACGLAWSRFYEALTRDPELERRYERALQTQADVDADMVVDVLSPEHCQDPTRARALSEAHRWRASIRNRRKYGAQIDLVVDTGPNIRDALALALSRSAALRPISDQPSPALAQIIDVEALPCPQLTDSDSVDDAQALARLLGDAD